MRRQLFTIGAICLFLLSACEIETSDNGDLDGFWILERVDSLSNGAVRHYDDHRPYWSFQFKLLQLSNLYDNTIIYRYEKEDGRLSLNKPCMFDRALGDTLVTDVEVLKPYGINAINENFTVKELNSGNMILESSLLRLHFKKH